MHPSERIRLLVVLAAALMLVAVGLAYRPATDAAVIGPDHTIVRDETWQHARLGQLFVEPIAPRPQTGDAYTPPYHPLALVTYRFDLALGETD